MKERKKLSTKSIAQIAIFTAVISILSQITFPLPSGVPVTLQTLAIALTGYVLGAKFATFSTCLYILIGGIGAPVFAGFSGGPGSFVSPSGGFIWGFIFMAFLCGIGIQLNNKIAAIAAGLLGLIICHLLGILQYATVTNTPFQASFLAVSLPFLIKDVISIALGYALAVQIRKALFAANLLEKND